MRNLRYHAERDNIVDNPIILFHENRSASYRYDETGESESESITSEPNNDLGGFDEQICGPLPSNDDHVNVSPSKYNTTDLVNKNLPKKLEIAYNQTLQAIISEPSAPNLKYEKPDPQTGDDDDDQPIKLSEGHAIPCLYNYVNKIYTDMQEYKNLCKSLSNHVFNLTNRKKRNREAVLEI